MDSDTLIRQAVKCSDDNQRLKLVCEIVVLKSSIVMRTIRQLMVSSLVDERYVAVWIIGELGHPERPFLRERFVLLEQLLATEKSPKVRERAILSVGRLRHAKSHQLLISFSSSRRYKDRLAAAQALPAYRGSDTETALIDLTKDLRPTVREWAFFGLGIHECQEHRDHVVRALMDGVSDTYHPAAYEAVRGLAAIGEFNRLGILLDCLESYGVHPILVDTVNELIANLANKSGEASPESSSGFVMTPGSRQERK